MMRPIKHWLALPKTRLSGSSIAKNSFNFFAGKIKAYNMRFMTSENLDVENGSVFLDC